jgi:hypothetical protein
MTSFSAGFRSQIAPLVSTHATVYNTFNVQHHLISAHTHRALRATVVDTVARHIRSVLKIPDAPTLPVRHMAK